jgi:hypothetical protein
LKTSISAPFSIHWASTSTCRHLPAHVGTCRHLPAHAGTYGLLASAGRKQNNVEYNLTICCLAYRILAGASIHLPAPAGTCRHLPAPAGTCRHLPAPAGTCRHLPAPTGTYRHLPAPTGLLRLQLETSISAPFSIHWASTFTCRHLDNIFG